MVTAIQQHGVGRRGIRVQFFEENVTYTLAGKQTVRSRKYRGLVSFYVDFHQASDVDIQGIQTGEFDGDAPILHFETSQAAVLAVAGGKTQAAFAVSVGESGGSYLDGGDVQAAPTVHIRVKPWEDVGVGLKTNYSSLLADCQRKHQRHIADVRADI